MGISWQELIVVLLIVLVLFGPKRLPEIGSSLGRGIRGFKQSLDGREQAPATVEAAPHESAVHASTPHPSASHQTTDQRPVAVPVEVVEPSGDA